MTRYRRLMKFIIKIGKFSLLTIGSTGHIVGMDIHVCIYAIVAASAIMLMEKE